MLDNEPTGGADTPADTTDQTSETQTTETQTSKTQAPDAQPSETAPPAGETPVKTVRRTKAAAKAPAKRVRKKAVPAEAAAEPPAETPGEPATDAPVKAPRKRAPRKAAAKAAPALETPAAEVTAPEPAAMDDPLPDLALPLFDAATPAEDETDPTLTTPGAPPLSALFVAPEPVVAPAPTRSRRSRAAKAAEPTDAEASGAEPDETTDDTTSDSAGTTDGSSVEPDESGDGSSRRRRGRRGRGRARGGEDDSAEDATAETPAEPEAAEETSEATSDDDSGSGSSRRRRRRRRRGEDVDVETASSPREERPARAPREPRDSDSSRVRSVSGSVRLEAKRQRRKEGRDAGRKRAPILTEAEFLARRESVDRRMIVRQNGERTQIAVLEDDVLVEHYVTRASAESFAGGIYLGRVQNVLPSMEAAFVDIGKKRNAVLYAGEVNWDLVGLEGRQRHIEQAMKSGDKVLVQVTKDPIGHKGARLTSQISLPGRYLVFVPGGTMTGISRKLPDTERQRLKDILRGIVPEEAGVIIRTAAEGASEEELTRDVRRLTAQWEVIQKKAADPQASAPSALYEEPDLAIRVVRDLFNEDFASMTVSGDDAWDTISAYIQHVAPDLTERLQHWTSEQDVFVDNRVDEQLAKALDRKVFLPSGGSLVIDHTEAMTVIDVNTGKFTGSGGNLEQTVTRNNLEAAEEIVRQLRLRDVGGIVVIDFIDMILESNRELVLRRLTECLGRDRTKHQVAEVTSLGLVQMTRKRVGQGLLDAFSEPCEVCHGRGVIVHSEPVDRSAADRGNGGHEPERRSRGSRRSDPAKSDPTPEPKPAEPAPDVADGERPKGRRERGGRRRASAPAGAPESSDAPNATLTISADVPAPEPTDAPAAEPSASAEPLPPATPPVESPVAAAEPTPTVAADQVNGTDAPPAPPRRRRAASRPAGPPVVRPEPQEVSS